MFLQVLVGDAVAIGMRHHQIANKYLQKKRIFATRLALPCWERNSRYGCVSPSDCQRRRSGGSHCMALPPLSAYVGPGAAPREKISHQEKKRMQVQSSQGSCPATALLLLLLPPSTAWHLWGLHWFFLQNWMYGEGFGRPFFRHDILAPMLYRFDFAAIYLETLGYVFMVNCTVIDYVPVHFPWLLHGLW